MSGKKKLTARKKLLDSEEEKAEEGEKEGEGEQREMETDTVPVAGPSGLTRSQVSSFLNILFRYHLHFLHLCSKGQVPVVSQLLKNLHHLTDS